MAQQKPVAKNSGRKGFGLKDHGLENAIDDLMDIRSDMGQQDVRLEAALETLRNFEDAQKLTAAKESITASYKGRRKKTRGEHGFVFMVDGSGSMSGQRIQTALSAVDAFNEVAAPAGAAAAAYLWGAHSSLHKAESNSQALFGSVLGHAAKVMLDFSEKSQDMQKTMHFVLIGDGDVVDSQQAYLTFESMLETCPNASIDFVIMADPKYQTRLDEIAYFLKKKFPKQVAATHVPHNKTGAVVKAAADTVKRRLKPLKKIQGKKPSGPKNG